MSLRKGPRGLLCRICLGVLCFLLAFEVDLAYCMHVVDTDRSNLYPALQTAGSIFPYAQQTLLVEAYVAVYMC